MRGFRMFSIGYGSAGANGHDQKQLLFLSEVLLVTSCVPMMKHHRTNLHLVCSRLFYGLSKSGVRFWHVPHIPNRHFTPNAHIRGIMNFDWLFAQYGCSHPFFTDTSQLWRRVLPKKSLPLQQYTCQSRVLLHIYLLFQYLILHHILRRRILVHPHQVSWWAVRRGASGAVTQMPYPTCPAAPLLMAVTCCSFVRSWEKTAAL